MASVPDWTPTESRRYMLWTDGGCHPNPGGFGGWAFILYAPSGEDLRLAGSEIGTTNNRMEIVALIEGLASVPDGESVVVHTDSAYLKGGSESWAEGWRKRGWRKRDGELALNPDLWQRVLEEKGRLGPVEFVKVKGHSDEQLNNECDWMATEARVGTEASVSTMEGVTLEHA